MKQGTLRQKFAFGLISVVVVSVLLLIGTRLLGKGALFHYLEREHLTRVQRVAAQFEGLAAPDRGNATLDRNGVIVDLQQAHDIASRIDVELFTVETWAFRLLGYGGVIDLPHKDMGEIASMLRTLRATSGPLGAAEVASLSKDIASVMDNSNRFGPLVFGAVEFVHRSVILINLFGIGVLVGTFMLLRRATLKPLEEAVDTARRIASGDLSHPVTNGGSDELGRLTGALEEMRGNLARLVSEVRAGSTAVAGEMQQIAAGGEDLAGRTERQAAALEETAATMEQITATVRHSRENVVQATALSLQATEVATQGAKEVEQVVEGMNEIVSASNRIAEITKMIDGIAFQTNILALNAAVEAARAGEQGRGFAVVAAEVRTLAQRSASAAKEIGALIGQTVDQVQARAAQAHDAGKTIQNVVASVQRVNGLIGEMVSGFREQETGITQIDQAIGELDKVTQQNALLVSRAAAATRTVRERADTLVRAVSVFQV